MKNLVLTLAAVATLSCCGCELEIMGRPADAGAPALVDPPAVTVKQRIENLKAEYQQLAGQVEQGKEQMLRLEGAIRILEIMEKDASTSATATTGTAVK